jgi:hypothetical protein
MAGSDSFVHALLSERRSPEIPAADDIFDFLIGSWTIDAITHER